MARFSVVPKTHPKRFVIGPLRTSLRAVTLSAAKHLRLLLVTSEYAVIHYSELRDREEERCTVRTLMDRLSKTGSLTNLVAVELRMAASISDSTGRRTSESAVSRTHESCAASMQIIRIKSEGMSRASRRKAIYLAAKNNRATGVPPC